MDGPSVPDPIPKVVRQGQCTNAPVCGTTGWHWRTSVCTPHFMPGRDRRQDRAGAGRRCGMS